MAPPQPRRVGHSASAPSLIGGGRQDDPQRDMSTRPGRQPSGPLATVSTSALSLYASPSYSSLYIEPEDLEPGPGSYDLPGGSGNQRESNRESLPSVSLTAKHEKSWAKVMITKNHLDVLKGRDTPGPGAYKPGSIPTQARVRFGTGKRPAINDTKFRAPGPVYETRGAPDDPPTKIRFGKANRFERDGEALSKSLGSTGPGQYEQSTVFDCTRLAKSFGASNRAYDRVRFPGSERLMIGKESPGPGPGEEFCNNGVSMSFGRAERLPTSVAVKRAPGPGAYENHEKPFPFSRNQSVHSFGRPHPKGRLNWNKMRHCHNTTWGLA